VIQRKEEAMDKCEICGEWKPCGKISAFRCEQSNWTPTVDTVTCVDCAPLAGQIAAASVKSWASPAKAENS
jgi:hypothetical protein